MRRPKTSHGTYFFSLACTCVVGGGFLCAYSIAHASVFSFSKEAHAEEPATTSPLNSQTIPLPRTQGSAPSDVRGGGDVHILDNDAVSLDANPFTDQEENFTSSDQIAWYVVREGDVLSQIATMFGVSANTIIWANNLSSSKDIHLGQTLLILPISGIRHTVVAGDTPASLAKKYSGNEKEIIAYNNLTNGTLAVGSIITIPGGEKPVEKKTITKKKTGAQYASLPTVSGFMNPLPGGIKTQGAHGYNGSAIDIGAPVGTPIIASAGGTVILSRADGGWNGGYGNYTVIDHANGTQTLYAHMSKNITTQGQAVKQGEVIGYVGNTGHSTGPHLHFEVRGAKNPF